MSYHLQVVTFKVLAAVNTVGSPVVVPVQSLQTKVF
jgi:hypothetical protein